jgi:subfamily B ATP-binding cassette protein MsbA
VAAVFDRRHLRAARLGSYASEFGLAWIGSRVVYDLRCEACDHLLHLPTSFYDATSAGFLLSRITFDAQQIAATASEAITVSIRNSLTIAFMLGYLFYINWELTLIALFTVPPLAFSLRKMRRANAQREQDGAGSHRRA